MRILKVSPLFGLYVKQHRPFNMDIKRLLICLMFLVSSQYFNIGEAAAGSSTSTKKQCDVILDPQHSSRFVSSVGEKKICWKGFGDCYKHIYLDGLKESFDDISNSGVLTYKPKSPDSKKWIHTIGEYKFEELERNAKSIIRVINSQQKRRSAESSETKAFYPVGSNSYWSGPKCLTHAAVATVYSYHEWATWYLEEKETFKKRLKAAERKYDLARQRLDVSTGKDQKDKILGELSKLKKDHDALSQKVARQQENLNSLRDDLAHEKRRHADFANTAGDAQRDIDYRTLGKKKSRIRLYSEELSKIRNEITHEKNKYPKNNSLISDLRKKERKLRGDLRRIKNVSDDPSTWSERQRELVKRLEKKKEKYLELAKSARLQFEKLRKEYEPLKTKVNESRKKIETLEGKKKELKQQYHSIPRGSGVKEKQGIINAWNEYNKTASRIQKEIRNHLPKSPHIENAVQLKVSWAEKDTDEINLEKKEEKPVAEKTNVEGSDSSTLANGSCEEDITYQSDFQSGDTSHWSHSNLSADNKGKKTLGLFNNDQVQLKLSGVKAGNYKVKFDFYTLHTWDGNGENGYGPDSFSFLINGKQYLNATFSTAGHSAISQSYSKSTPLGGVKHPNQTDNSGVNLLHYSSSQGTVANFRYSPELTVDHPGGDLTLSFNGSVSQPSQTYLGFPDEVWALDDVSVKAESGSKDCSQGEKESNSCGDITGKWRINWSSGDGSGDIHFKTNSDGNILGLYDSEQNGHLFLNKQGEGLSGYWVENQSNKDCGKSKQGSTHWGLVKLSCSSDKNRISGTWGYCESNAHDSLTLIRDSDNQEPSGWIEYISQGNRFSVVLNKTADKFDDSKGYTRWETSPLGAVKGGETYSCIYSGEAFSCTGFYQTTGKVETINLARWSADPTKKKISIWGLILTFDEKGNVFSLGESSHKNNYGLVGELKKDDVNENKPLTVPAPADSGLIDDEGAEFNDPENETFELIAPDTSLEASVYKGAAPAEVQVKNWYCQINRIELEKLRSELEQNRIKYPRSMATAIIRFDKQLKPDDIFFYQKLGLIDSWDKYKKGSFLINAPPGGEYWKCLSKKELTSLRKALVRWAQYITTTYGELNSGNLKDKGSEDRNVTSDGQHVLQKVIGRGKGIPDHTITKEGLKMLRTGDNYAIWEHEGHTSLNKPASSSETNLVNLPSDGKCKFIETFTKKEFRGSADLIRGVKSSTSKIHTFTKLYHLPKGWTCKRISGGGKLMSPLPGGKAHHMIGFGPSVDRAILDALAGASRLVGEHIVSDDQIYDHQGNSKQGVYSGTYSKFVTSGASSLLIRKYHLIPSSIKEGPRKTIMGELPKGYYQVEVMVYVGQLLVDNKVKASQLETPEMHKVNVSFIEKDKPELE